MNELCGLWYIDISSYIFFKIFKFFFYFLINLLSSFLFVNLVNFISFKLNSFFTDIILRLLKNPLCLYFVMVNLWKYAFNSFDFQSQGKLMFIIDELRESEVIMFWCQNKSRLILYFDLSNFSICLHPTLNKNCIT